jgi:hypothetical protein
MLNVPEQIIVRVYTCQTLCRGRDVGQPIRGWVRGQGTEEVQYIDASDGNPLRLEKRNIRAPFVAECQNLRV